MKIACKESQGFVRCTVRWTTPSPNPITAVRQFSVQVGPYTPHPQPLVTTNSLTPILSRFHDFLIAFLNNCLTDSSIGVG